MSKYRFPIAELGLWLLCAVLSGCLNPAALGTRNLGPTGGGASVGVPGENPGSGVSGPFGNGEGINGRNLLNFGNARLKCDFALKGRREYAVTCLATIIKDGLEIIADGIEAGTEVLWSDPFQLEGVPVDSISCTVSAEKRDQLCTVRVSSEQDAKLGFSFRVRQAGNTRFETEEVKLPYGVRTFGRLPPLTRHAARPNGAEVSSEQPFGAQADPIPPEEAFLGRFAPIAECGGKLYGANAGFIYEMDQAGKLRVFAGSGNTGSTEERSHGLRVHFGTQRFLMACHPLGGVVVSSGTSGHLSDIIRITAEGNVSVLGRAYASDWNRGVNYVRDMTLSQDGSIYFGDYYGIVRLSAGGEWRRIDFSAVPEAYRKIAALAVTTSGLVYFTPVNSSNLPSATIHRFNLADNTYGGIVGTATANSVNGAGIKQMSISRSGDLYLLLQEGSVARWVNGVIDKPIAAPAYNNVDDYGHDCNQAKSDAELSSRRASPITAIAYSPVAELLYTEGCRVRAMFKGTPSVTVLRTYERSISAARHTDPESSIFGSIKAVQITEDGAVYFADANTYNIYRISADGKSMMTYSPFSKFSIWHQSAEGGLPHVLLAQTPDGKIYAAASNLGYWGANPDYGALSGLARLNDDGTYTPIPNPPKLKTLTAFAAGANNTFYFAVLQTSPARELLATWVPGQPSSSVLIATDTLYQQSLAMTLDAELWLARWGQTSGISVNHINPATGAVLRTLASAGNSQELNSRAIATDSRKNLYALKSGTYGDNQLQIFKRKADGTYSPDPTFSGGSGAGSPDQGPGGFGAGGWPVISWRPGSSLDCTGGIRRSGLSHDPLREIRSALSALCQGVVEALAVRDSCYRADGVIHIVYGQQLKGTNLSNLVRITRPCD